MEHTFYKERKSKSPYGLLKKFAITKKDVKRKATVSAKCLGARVHPSFSKPHR